MKALERIKLDPLEVIRQQELAEQAAYDLKHEDPEPADISPEEHRLREEERHEALTHSQETLKPVPLHRLKLPKILVVRFVKNHPENMGIGFSPNLHFILIGENAQMPGHVIVQCVKDAHPTLFNIHVDRLELVPVSEL